jgi:hypothetical protein
MADYKELREGWEYTSSVQGGSGTRVFIDETGGTASLPAIGDSFSGVYINVICTSIKETLYHVEGAADKKKYVCTYSARNNTATFHRKERTDEDNFVNSGGSEMVSIDNPKSWYWVPLPWVNSATEGLKKGKMYKNTIRGALSKTLIFSPTGSHSYQNFMSEQVFPKLGKINQNALAAADWSLAFKKGNVLFINYDSSLVTDEDGDDKWEVTLNFAYRILEVPLCPNGSMGVAAGSPNIEQSWNFYLFPDEKSVGHPEWQMVTNTKGVDPPPACDFDNDFVYKTTDFMGNSANFKDLLGTET